MSDRKRRSAVELGHDAFLDIVANLVGILIILVVILGTQTEKIREALREEAEAETEIVQADEAMPPETYATTEQLDSLAQLAMRAASANQESLAIDAKFKRYEDELSIAQRQRAQLLDLIEVAKAAWDDAKKGLDAEKVAAAKLQTEFDIASSELASLAGTKEELSKQAPPTVAVEHLPTPMAKTVFGDEIHFRLKDNHLSLVPVDLLIAEIKTDLNRTLAGSREGRTVAAVGPVRGYVAHYAMDREVGRMTNNGRTAMGVRVSLVGMTLEPVSEPSGQPIGAVLAQGSMLDIELAGRDPASTTITVWVYPDSFAAFRGLKENLYRRGFATAARPLPMDEAITAGPGGSKSKSQ